MKHTSRVALGGILSAVSVATLLLTIFPFATYALPPLAGAFLIPLVIECGKKWAWCAYAAVSLVGLLIVPDIEAKMLFVAFFGYYPIIKASLESLKNRLMEWVAKFSLFNLAVVIAYMVLSRIGFSFDEFRIEGVPLSLSAFLLVFLIAGNIIFLIYDIGLSRALPLYFIRFQPVLRKIFRI